MIWKQLNQKKQEERKKTFAVLSTLPNKRKGNLNQKDKRFFRCHTLKKRLNR